MFLFINQIPETHTFALKTVRVDFCRPLTNTMVHKRSFFLKLYNIFREDTFWYQIL